MGVLPPVSAHAVPSAQPPINICGIFPAPSNISPNPSEVISEVSDVYDDFCKISKPYDMLICNLSNGGMADPGSYIPDLGGYIPDPGSYIPDPGGYIPDLGGYIPDPGGYLP